MTDGPHQPQWRWWLAFVIIPIVAAAITIYPNISEWWSPAERIAESKNPVSKPNDQGWITDEQTSDPYRAEWDSGDKPNAWRAYCALSRAERSAAVRDPDTAARVTELVDWRTAQIKGRADLDCSWIGRGDETVPYIGTLAADKLCWRFCCPGQGKGDPGCP